MAENSAINESHIIVYPIIIISVLILHGLRRSLPFSEACPRYTSDSSANRLCTASQMRATRARDRAHCPQTDSPYEAYGSTKRVLVGVRRVTHPVLGAQTVPQSRLVPPVPPVMQRKGPATCQRTRAPSD